MGDRYELDLKCAYCGEKNEVWYAPTCASDTFKCKKCGKKNFITHNLETKKIEEATIDDVIGGFLMTTNVSRTEKETNQICKEHLQEIKKEAIK